MIEFRSLRTFLGLLQRLTRTDIGLATDAANKPAT